MKYAVVIATVLYLVIAIGVFVMHTQMPVTFWLAILRSVLWPVWIAGGLRGRPLPIGDEGLL